MNTTLKLILLDTLKFSGYGVAIVSALTPFVPGYAGLAGAILGGVGTVAKEILANAPIETDVKSVADTVQSINEAAEQIKNHEKLS